MRISRAIGPLMLRPLYGVGMPFMFLVLVLTPFYMLPQIPSTPDWRGPANLPVFMQALWMETIMISGFMGTMIGMATGEVRRTMIGWLLPSFRRDVLVESTVVLVLTAAAASYIQWGFRGNPVTAFGISIISFVTAFVWTERKGEWWSRIIVVLLIAIAIRPELLLLVLRIPPLLVLAAAGASYAWFVQTELSIDAQREDALSHWMDLERDLRKNFGSAGPGALHPKTMTNPSSFAIWRATVNAINPNWRDRAKALMITACIPAVMGYVTNDISMVGILMFSTGAFMPASAALPTQSTLPISRKQRAHVSHLSNALSAWLYCAIATAVGILLFSFPVFPHFHSDRTKAGPLSIIPAVALLLVWVPLVQWALSYPPVREMIEMRKRGPRLTFRTVSSFVMLFVMIWITVLLSDRYLQPRGSLWVYGAAVLAAAATNGICLVMMRRAYGRADLV